MDQGEEGSESGSDSRSGSDDGSKKSNASKSSGSSKSGSASGSGSGSSSSSSSGSASGSGSESEKAGPSPAKVTPDSNQDIKQCWKENPDVYGIRRSGRSRKEPERLKAGDSDSSDKSPKKKVLPAKKQSSRSNTWNSESSHSESEDERRSRPLPSKPPSRRGIVSKPSRGKTVEKKPARRRRNSDSSDDESSVDSEEENRRHANRRAATSVSYKEVSDDDKTGSEDLLDVDEMEPEVPAEPDNSETIERVLARRMGRKGATGNKTVTYAMDGTNDGECEVEEAEDTETQYLIKWKGWSNIHNTWESDASLKDQKVKGLKKLENFVKREQDLNAWQRYATPEDVEYYECQLELQHNLQASFSNVERIIAESTLTKKDGYCDYYIKWENLPYSDMTLEDGKLITDKWPEKVKEFRERQNSVRTPSKICRVLKHRPKFVKLLEQPSYMGADNDLVLRDYQLDGVNWLIHSWCKENSVILADEMGLGKTIQTICFLYYLFRTYDLYGPFIIIVPLSTMTSWQREFSQWAPEMNVVTYLGDIKSRNIIRENEWLFYGTQRIKFNAILTTYEIVLKDKAFLGEVSWAALLVDEAHRLKNDDSLLYKALMEFRTNHRLLITGTPLQNSLKELWSLLQFIMPHKFYSWEEFEKDHENSNTKGYSRLHKQLEPFIIRRVKKEVEKSLPAKVEQILRVEMTTLQKQYYKWILTKNFTALRKGQKGSTTTFLNIVIELKKCCNHAYLTKPMDSEHHRPTAEDQCKQLIRGSGKLVLLDKLLVRLKETGHRVLIFSQMVRMLDILAEYLQYRRFSFQRLDGGIKGELRKQALDHFNAENSQDFCFLLSTRAGGLGINLATADTVIIFDSDWNPQNDLQAQARAHRIGQKNQVMIYRLVTKNSVEEEIVERAKQKMVLDHLVIQRMDTTGRTVLDKKSAKTTTPFNKDDLTAILKFGAQDLFKDEEEGDEEPICDIDDILRRAEVRDDAPAMVGDELLSAFKVASFAAFDEDKEVPVDDTEPDDNSKDWDEIIPENIRKKVQDDERKKEESDLYLPPRSRKTLKTLQQINQSDSEGEGSGRSKRRKKTDESESSGDEGSGDDERPKKRGRPRVTARETIKGFSDVEIRRFVKSYKKFSVPLKRLEAVACDAELQEKPLAELMKLGQMLQERCKAAMIDMQSQKENQGSQGNQDSSTYAAGPKRKRGPSFKLGNVSVNAKSLSACEKEMEPLDEALPPDPAERKKWTLDVNVRAANFDVVWEREDDSKLLQGIYTYGMGSWEQIKMDPSLGIGDKIMTNNVNEKPQAKHLQSRADYLLKILRKTLDQKKGVTKPKRQRKARENKILTKEIIENDISSGDEKSTSSAPKKSDKPTKKVDKLSEETKVSEEGTDLSKDLEKKERRRMKKEKREARKKKKVSGPMHFTANSEPRALEVLGELDPVIFDQCKEKMRPVKKALKALDNPDQSLSEQDAMEHTRTCLLQIGDQINKCLGEYKDSVRVKEWRSNLWYFVSKFTEYHAKKLFKLYKHAVKKEGERKGNVEKKVKVEGGAKVKEEPGEKESRKRKGDEDRDAEKGTPPKRRQISESRSRGKEDRKDKDKDGDRKKSDPSSSKVRHDSGGSNTPRKDNNISHGGPTTPQRPPVLYSGSPAGGDRWGANQGNQPPRDRFAGDHKRDRFTDSYQRLPSSSGYHRDRDRNDRNHRNNMADPRRFPVGSNYGNHYQPPAFGAAPVFPMGDNNVPYFPRERFPPGHQIGQGGGFKDSWQRSGGGRDRDHRRDHDRRPTANS